MLMEKFLNIFSTKKDNTYKQVKIELDILQNEIKEIRSQLEHTDIWFQTENDTDLIDACLYQRKFLNARYQYLIKRIRCLDKSIKILELTKSSEKSVRDDVNYDK